MLQPPHLATHFADNHSSFSYILTEGCCCMVRHMQNWQLEQNQVFLVEQLLHWTRLVTPTRLYVKLESDGMKTKSPFSIIWDFEKLLLRRAYRTLYLKKSNECSMFSSSQHLQICVGKSKKKESKRYFMLFFLICFTSRTVPPADLRELNLNQAPVDTALHYSRSAYS